MTRAISEPAPEAAVELPVLDIDLLATKHLRAVQRIDTLVYPKPWSLSLLRQEIKLDNRFHIVGTIAGRVVGHGGLMLVGDEAHVTTIAVDPGEQSGVGSALLLALVDQARNVGAAALTLEVRVSNERARALYAQFGFVPAGVRKRYYADTNEDALVMWASDIGSDDFAARIEPIRQKRRPVRFLPSLERVLQ